jgi:hypothetical protein
VCERIQLVARPCVHGVGAIVRPSVAIVEWCPPSDTFLTPSTTRVFIAHKMRDRSFFITALGLAMAYPEDYSDASMAQCAQNNCPAAHGQTPAAGNALSVTGKADGGQYTPGEQITLTNTGGGQYALYASSSANGAPQRENNADLTITAPAAGPLALVSVRAAGRNQCT